MSDKDKNKDSEKEKPKPRVTADKEVASGCADINAPRVTRAGRPLQQASKNTKSRILEPSSKIMRTKSSNWF